MTQREKSQSVKDIIGETGLVVYPTHENKSRIMILTENGWESATSLKYHYPEWIKFIPTRWLRTKIRRAIYDGTEAYDDD